jgi:hypothetical protein
MKVVFKSDAELSVLHALAVVALSQPCIDGKLETLLSPAAAVVNDRLELAELDVSVFWQSLVRGAGSSDTARVEVALLQAGCSELGVESLMPAILGRLGDARMAMRERFPKLKEQLPLRSGPLRDLWDATGPGLLREIGRRTIEKLVPARTHVLLVQPVRGGDGDLLDGKDSVWMEAMLTHPEPAIPETLRVAWLVARKGFDHESANRWVESDRLPRAAAMALLPIVLAAGEELGLCRESDESIRLTAKIWHVGRDVEALLRWWSQMRQGELPLPVAIRALDKMLG